MIEKLTSTESCTFEIRYKELVQKIVQIRQQAWLSQKDVADWINVDRRKIIEFETSENYNINLLLKLCDKFSIDLELNFVVN